MTTDTHRNPANRKPIPSKSDSAEIIRQLEQFPAEVLEAALLVLRIRASNTKT